MEKNLRIVALVAGAWGVMTGVWGLVNPGDLSTPAGVEESIRWAASGILAVAIAVVCAVLAARRG